MEQPHSSYCSAEIPRRCQTEPSLPSTPEIMTLSSSSMTTPTADGFHDALHAKKSDYVGNFRDSGVWGMSEDGSGGRQSRGSSISSTSRTRGLSDAHQVHDDLLNTLNLSPTVPNRPRNLNITTRTLSRPIPMSLPTQQTTTLHKPGFISRTQTEKEDAANPSRTAPLSPSRLLNHRLGLGPAPKKSKHADPQTPSQEPGMPPPRGCVRPSSLGSTGRIDVSSIRGHTMRGSPAWWCHIDKLVVFDGMDASSKPLTRSSKGLAIARRNGVHEAIIVPLECAHCREMFGREVWKFSVKVCPRSVCAACKLRCLEEAEELEKRRKSPGQDDILDYYDADASLVVSGDGHGSDEKAEASVGNGQIIQIEEQQAKHSGVESSHPVHNVGNSVPDTTNPHSSNG